MLWMERQHFTMSLLFTLSVFYLEQHPLPASLSLSTSSSSFTQCSNELSTQTAMSVTDLSLIKMQGTATTAVTANTFPLTGF